MAEEEGMFLDPIAVQLDHLLGLTGTEKLALMGPSYTFSSATVNMSEIAASELDVTGYTKGYGGAGRKTLSLTRSAVGEAQAVKDGTTYTWTIDLAGGGKPAGFLILRENIDDANSKTLYYQKFTTAEKDAMPSTGSFPLQLTADATNGFFRSKVLCS